MSIRLRLTLWYSAVLLLGLAAFGAGMWFVLKQRLFAAVDATLQQRIQGLKTTLEVEAKLPASDLRQELIEFASEVPEGTLMQLHDEHGVAILPAANTAWMPEDSGFRTVSHGGRTYRILSAAIEANGVRYRATAGADLRMTRQVAEDFRYFLLLTIPVVLILAGLGGYWISSRALAPVDEITRVAKSISVQNLSRRLEVPRTNDEIQRMSEAWNDVLERLDTAVNRIRQFTADASHELRTPVAFVRATAELALRRERSVIDYRNALSQIRAETERMTELTENLLALARVEGNGVSLPLENTNLGRLVSDVVEQTQPAAVEKGITVIRQTEYDVLSPANEPALRRLLLILLDNALKHTPSGGKVTVQTVRMANAVSLEVADTGEGIATEVLPHIFERFYTGDPMRKSGGGAGLGLAIAQAIAHAHNSSLTVESELGKGSRFRLVLSSS